MEQTYILQTFKMIAHHIFLDLNKYNKYILFKQTFVKYVYDHTVANYGNMDCSCQSKNKQLNGIPL